MNMRGKKKRKYKYHNVHTNQESRGRTNRLPTHHPLRLYFLQIIFKKNFMFSCVKQMSEYVSDSIKSSVIMVYIMTKCTIQTFSFLQFIKYTILREKNIVSYYADALQCHSFFHNVIVFSLSSCHDMSCP